MTFLTESNYNKGISCLDVFENETNGMFELLRNSESDNYITTKDGTNG